MEAYLVKLIDPTGIVRSVVVEANDPMEAYGKAGDSLQAEAGTDDLRFFGMEKGILTDVGWATFYSCTL